MDETRRDVIEFIKKWRFEHKRNWPNDPPRELTFDGNDVIQMMVEFATSSAPGGQQDSGNYVADDEVFPSKIVFSNGRVVEIVERTDDVKGWYLSVSPKSEYPKPCGIAANTR